MRTLGVMDEIVGLDSERFFYNAGLAKASSVGSGVRNKGHADVVLHPNEVNVNITDVVKSLQSATSGSKELDSLVATAVGWNMREIAGQRVWIAPSLEERDGIPGFTTNLQDASELARSILPSEVGGFGWEGGRASAKIGVGQPTVEASTPALALCIASLVAHWRSGGA